MLLDESVGDWELEKHLMRKATDWGIPQELVPKVRVLDELPGPESFVVPFSLLRMLHVLFQDFRQSTWITPSDMLDFQALLVKSGVLATGTSIEKDDEMGRNWRQIEASQQFLVPQRVFIADGRSGTFSPPKGDGHLRFVCLSDTHGQHRELSSRLPPGDVLLHGGSASNGILFVVCVCPPL
eukprot:g32272.t1